MLAVFWFASHALLTLQASAKGHSVWTGLGDVVVSNAEF